MKTLYLTINGETKSFTEWCDEKQLTKSSIRQRCRKFNLSKEEVIKNGRVVQKHSPITIDGVTLPIREWAKKSGVHERTIRQRLKKMSPTYAVFTPVGSIKPGGNKGKILTINGESHNVGDWCKIRNITTSCYNSRRRRGMSIETAIMTPKRGGKC